MRRIWIVGLLCVFGLAVMVWAGRVPVAQAGGVVGGGNPGSCTELQFDAALEAGGDITFNCGAAPFTLTVHQKTITLPTTLYGDGLITLSGGNLNRIFSVTVSGSLYLNDLRLTDGFANDASGGAAVYNAGHLVLKHSEVVHSLCISLCVGAGILNSGSLLLYNSLVSRNQMDVGGAITTLGTGSGQIFSSTISLNLILNGLSTGGAGLANFATGSLLVRDSSIISNSSPTDAGGILNAAGATIYLNNSTISGNSAQKNGGGLHNAGTLWLFNSTVTNNYADSNLDGVGIGAGIYNSNDFQFRNSILAANWESAFSINFGWIPHNGECAGTLTSIGYNVLENYNTSNCTINGPFTLAPPVLGPLARNGGPTLTHLPLPGSPAINGGEPNGCVDQGAETIRTDQRGVKRIGVCDLGAVERAFQLNLPLVRR